MVADRLRQLAELDDRAYAAPRMVAAVLVFQRAGWITGWITDDTAVCGSIACG